MPRKKKSSQSGRVHEVDKQTGFNECRMEVVVGPPNVGTRRND